MSSLERYNSKIFAYQYEYTKGRSDNNGDIEFYIDKLRVRSGKTLEIGSGTGRITEELKKNGVDIIGLDNAEAMVNLAKNKSAKQGLDIEYITSNIFDFESETKFKNIIIPFNTICFFENSELLEIFKKIQYFLGKEDGRLLFDFTRPLDGTYKEVLTRDAKWSDPIFIEELKIYIKWRMEAHPEPANSLVKYRYDWEASEDKINWESLSSEMSFSSLSLDSYKAIFCKAGFKILEEVQKPYLRAGEEEIHYFCTLGHESHHFSSP